MRWIENSIQRVAGWMGYELRRIRRYGAKQPIPPRSKIYVGCGEDARAGYIGCDLRPLPHVGIVAKAWEISRYCNQADEIYSRHLLEHLTLQEVRTTLKDWHRALASDGVVRIEVPNLDVMIHKWSHAIWNGTELANNYSNARWGLAGLYGWQRECDPAGDSYSPNYWDVHKMGFNAPSLRYFLEEAGFHNINIWCEGFTAEQIRRRGVGLEDCRDCHLLATASKPARVESKAA